MANCSKCGSVTDFVKGVSKKTGKPYEGNKCNSCGNIDFIRKQFQPPVQQAQQQEPKNNDIELLKLAVQMACRDEGMPTIDNVQLFFNKLKSILSGNIQDEGVPF